MDSGEGEGGNRGGGGSGSRKERVHFLPNSLSLFLFHTSSSSFPLSEKSIVINTTERGRGEKSPQRNLRFQVEEFGFLRMCGQRTADGEGKKMAHNGTFLSPEKHHFPFTSMQRN